MSASSRGQANLLAVAAAVVVLVSSTGLGVLLATGAVEDADRQPRERYAAATVADRLVAPGAPTTRRADVIDADRIDNLSLATLRRIAPPARGRSVRVELDGRTVASTSPAGGTTVSRAVLVERRRTASRQIDLRERRAIVVPAGTARVDLLVATTANATVDSVYADGSVVRHADDGLDGPTTVAVDPATPTRIRLHVTVAGGAANATLGRVAVGYDVVERRPADLVVTVGA